MNQAISGYANSQNTQGPGDPQQKQYIRSRLQSAYNAWQKNDSSQGKLLSQLESLLELFNLGYESTRVSFQDSKQQLPTTILVTFQKILREMIEALRSTTPNGYIILLSSTDENLLNKSCTAKSRKRRRSHRSSRQFAFLPPGRSKEPKLKLNFIREHEAKRIALILISVLFNTGTHQTENATSISQGRSCHKPGSADKDRSEDGSGSENDEEDVADYAYNDEDESQDDGDYESGDEDDGIKNKDCGDNGNDDIDRDGVETYTDEKELPNRINSDPRRRFGGTLLEKSTDYETYRERHDGIGSRRLASFLVPLAKFYAYGENGGAHKPPPEDFYKFAELRERAVAV